MLSLSREFSQACFSKDYTDPLVCSSHGACVAPDLCSCYSGYNGTQCELVADPTCTWNNVTYTTTGFYPTLDTASIGFNNNNFEFTIKSPIVNQRRNFTIYINTEACSYPLWNFTSNFLDNTGTCVNSFQTSIPWSNSVNCSWTVVDTSDQTTYKGTIFTRATEVLDALRGYPVVREVTTAAPIEIIFKKRLFISTNTQVLSDVSLFSSITKQIFLVGPPPAGIFEILTSLQFPYKIDSSQQMNVSTYPTGLSPSLTDISDSNNCLANQPCTQMFRMNIDISTACSFTGTYTLQFKLKCHESVSPGNCTIDSTNENAQIILNVNSEDFCATTQVNIGLTGTLESFSQNDFATRKDSFLLGQPLYFQASLFSPKVSLVSSTVYRVQWELGATSKVLYDNYTITSDGTTEGFQVLTGSASTARFQFNTDAAWVTIPVDSSVSLNVSTYVDVTYSTAAGDRQERLLIQFDNYKTLQSIPVSGNQKSKTTKNIFVTRKFIASSSIQNYLNMFIICLILMFLNF